MAAKNIVYMIWERPCAEAAACPPVWQWDTGQLLRVQGLPITTGEQIHFSASGESYTSIVGVIDGVAYARIPDVVLQEAGTVPVYIYLSEDDATAETLYSGVLTVKARPQPTDYSTPTETEETLFQQAIDAVRIYSDQAYGFSDDAEGYATLAKSWAVGGTGTREGEDYDNSQYYAERAEAAAKKNGFVRFEVDVSDGHLYAWVTSGALTDVTTFAVNEETGELEVSFYE